MEQEFFAIKQLLDENKIDYEVSEHEPVYTSEDAARIRGVQLCTGVKSLIFKIDSSFVLLLVPGDKKVDSTKLRYITKAKDIRMATPEEVFQLTNCKIGSVHPFGNLMKITTYMDRKILKNDHVNFNVGLHTMSVRMDPHDLMNIVKPILVDLIKE